MSEAQTPSPDPEAVRTGIADVDAVLDSLSGLETVDVAEHPAVFEAAHERLRRALDGGVSGTSGDG